MKILNRFPDGNVEVMDPPEKEIRFVDGSALPLYSSPASGRSDILRQYVNPEQNSRLAVTLPAERWRVRWKAALRERNVPRHILQSGERIVVQSPVWEMFDMAGKQIWAMASGTSPLNIDPEHGHIYLIDRHGDLVGCSLSDGHELFSAMPLFGDQLTRSYLARHGDVMLMVGSERPLDPHGHYTPNRSIIEHLAFGDKLEISTSGVLMSARNEASLILETPTLVTAAAGDSLVVAVPDQLYTIDGALRVVSAFSGSFVPLAISLDEARRIYMVVSTDTGSKLWILSPAGELLFTADLPADLRTVDAPPVIGYDHRIYLQGAGRILAFDEKGDPLWESRPGARPGGVTVTADNRVLVSSGSDLCIYDSAGHCTLLHRFEGETLSTPAIITGSGVLLVATESNLYALEASENE